MDYEAWEPIYREILDDFGFSMKRDLEAAVLLSEQLISPPPLTRLEELISAKKVLVCGNGPGLSSEIADLEADGALLDRAIIAADGATSVLLRAGISPDVIVTDLDGTIEDIIDASKRGSIVVVHAHGDNIDKVREYLPRLRAVAGTCQCRPPQGLLNMGGFTDGDRSVFLAVHFRASEIALAGFEFDDPSVTPRKAKKLRWAKRLIEIALSGSL
ncbi:MAG: DUF115 domain-containing protein [Methanotrichaceae archaeon]|nr:DUF115 domain-containing protein [Methanotrichaceae archaeon]